MTEAKKTATLSEHVIIIRAAIRAALADGFVLSLEDAVPDYPYVDLERRTKEGGLVDWETVIESADLGY